MNSLEIIGPPPVKNPKHRLLADYFLRGGSGAQAAIDAGYSLRSASSQAAQILKQEDVAAYVAWHQSNESAQTQDIRALIDQELRDLAFANIADLTRVDSDGQLVPDFSTATRAQLKAVTGVSNRVAKRYDKDGNVLSTDKQSRFGFIDKTKATELLGKLHGFFKPDEQRLVVDVADRLLQARQRVAQLAQDSD